MKNNMKYLLIAFFLFIISCSNYKIIDPFAAGDSILNEDSFISGPDATDFDIEYNMREYLLANTNVEIPEIMVENAVNDDVKRMKDALAAYNVTLEDYLAQTGSNLKDYLANAKERTLKMIKTRYIYRKLLEENKIEVSAKELEEATKGMKDSHEIVRKENELLLDKLHKFLKDNNTIEVIE